ncbi:MAG: hypothetical protein RIB52_00735 [Erythrobacter sp.]|uniref:hypothetical protein n=1 Tax=Erythrobacter sp. TaxID=1042 RepID=UPI0032EB21C8
MEDISASAAVVGISVLLAFNFHAGGRHAYRTGFYWSFGNLALSVAVVAGNFGTLVGGWWAIPYLFGLSSVAYFTTLGALVTFKSPKNVECFRCLYVDIPRETDEDFTPYSESEWRAFRSLDFETKKARKP